MWITHTGLNAGGAYSTTANAHFNDIGPTQNQFLCGADIIKVGIGSGAVCTTRIQTGVGYPQLSAVIECADAAHGLGAHVISDGGCTGPGDVAKAFGAGADFVMLGGLLAGHDEGGGEIMEEMYELDLLQSGSYANDFEVRKFVKFYGMSSNSAQEKHGGIKTYRASEGRTVKVPYRGKIANTCLGAPSTYFLFGSSSSGY